MKVLLYGKKNAGKSTFIRETVQRYGTPPIFNVTRRKQLLTEETAPATGGMQGARFHAAEQGGVYACGRCCALMGSHNW